MDFEKNSSVYDRLLKTRRLHVRIRVTAAATPANKVYHQEMPEVVFLKTEGKDDITAIDAAASTDLSTQTDSDGKIGVLLRASTLGAIERVYASEIQALDGGTTTAVLVDTGTTDFGVSALGNAVIQIDSSQSLASVNFDAILVVEYLRTTD